MNKNEHCLKKDEIDRKIGAFNASLEDMEALLIANKYDKKYNGKEFMDPCDGITYKIIDVIVIPFNRHTRGPFMNAYCLNKGNANTAKESIRHINEYNRANWNIECITGPCDPDVIYSHRIEYVDYCLNISK